MTLLFKHGKAKWAWVPGIALAWALTTTMTASWQKVFSGNPRIGYFEQRSTYQAALDNGELLAPATDTDQMQQIITNSTVNGVLQALFALLDAHRGRQRDPHLGQGRARSGGLPTTEVPHEPSRLVAPSDFFATKEEKEAVREYERSQRELAGPEARR